MSLSKNAAKESGRNALSPYVIIRYNLLKGKYYFGCVVTCCPDCQNRRGGENEFDRQTGGRYNAVGKWI